MLKGVVGCGWVRGLGRVWVVVELWLKLVVGRGSAKLHTASLSSLIVDRRAGFGGWIGWVDRWVDRFETVDLLIGGWIGWKDHWSDDDIF